MNALVFAVAFAAYMLTGDLLIRLARILYPRRTFARLLRRLHMSILHDLLHLARILTGLRVLVESHVDAPLPPRVLVVSNHQSLLDIPFLMHALPELDLRFVAKEELGRGVPLVAASLRYGRHAVISRRGRFADTTEALRALACRDAVSPVVFPEGTRSRDGTVGPFHAAAVRLLAEAMDAPVLAVAVDGGQCLRKLSHLGRMAEVRYRVALLGLYPRPQGRAETLQLLEHIRRAIVRQQTLWRSEAPTQPGQVPTS